MPQGTILTTQGLLRLATATPEDQIGIAHLSVGDGSGGCPTLSPGMTAMTNEVWRGTALAPTRDPDNPNTLIFRAVIPIDVGGFTIREAALWDEYGDMIAIGHTAVIEKADLSSPYAVACTVKIRVRLNSTAEVNLFSVDDGGFDHAELSGRTAPGCHSMEAITGLVDELAGKSDTGHGHAISDVTGLASALSDLTSAISAVEASTLHVTARQTVISSPVDANGRPNFLAITGAKELTVNIGAEPPGPIISFAAGFDQYGAVDHLVKVNSAVVVDLSSTGGMDDLDAAGTYYIYADRDEDTGAVTFGIKSTSPNYSFGSPSIAFGICTFVVPRMKMYVGNGLAASAIQRVFIGELTYNGSSITAVKCYALCGRAVSDLINYPAAGGQASFDHNIGVDYPVARYRIVASSSPSEYGYSAGDIIEGPITGSAGSGQIAVHPITGRTAVSIRAPSSQAGQIINKTNGDRESLTPAKWKIQFEVDRGW